ncbi:MAG: YdcF family protein [Bacteroidia bacterium]|nr:YdcF family protein [Bacteroidia bacterium]
MLRIILYAIITCTVLIVACNIWIVVQTRKQIYSDINSIPENDVGLILGTSKYFSNGSGNLFFRYRIEAAAELFKKNKLKHIIVSGDNHVLEYNEAADMRKALLQQGVPDSCITLDYAGFRTLDSVVRCKKVFGQNKFTIISQEFHNQRALFISNHYDIEAVAYNAKAVPDQLSFTTKVREYFAKFKAVLDIYILHVEPKFLGDPVNVKV